MRRYYRLELELAFDGAAIVEQFEHLAFVGLVPGDFHVGDRADVEAHDQRRFKKFLDEGFVFADRGNEQGRPDFAEHFALRNFDDAGVWAEEFAIRKRVTEGIAPDDRRTQVDAAFKGGFARTVAMGRGGFDGAGSFEAFFDGV